MAGRTQPVNTGPGIGAAILVAVLILGALLAVALRAQGRVSLDTQDWAALRFTVLQAVLSAVLSVGLAVPVARALARRSFPGRGGLVTLLGAPFLLPVIVAILGLLAVFGRSGWVNDLLAVFGLAPVQIYGLHGVVLAHVFFNLPLATRLILQGWQSIPAERFRLAAQLGCGAGDVLRLLELPMLARVIPATLAVVFAICLTSFAVALTLGGGPRATTLELAIYQAFRFDFDLTRAAALSCLQIVLAGSAVLVALRWAPPEGFGAGMDRARLRWDSQGRWLRAQDGGVIFLAGMFLLVPLMAIVFAGAPGLVSLPNSVWRAALVSLGVAAFSCAVLMALAVPMAIAIAAGRHKWVDLAGLLGLTASPLVIGTGLFIVINPVTDPFALALPVTGLVNAVMALPFALRILVPGMRDVVSDHGRLGQSLGMAGWPFLWLVVLPRIRPQIGFAAGLGAALSMGDLGVIALFADPERATLPLQVYRLMGAYRMEAAAGASLLLLILTLGLFWVLDRGGRLNADP